MLRAALQLGRVLDHAKPPVLEFRDPAAERPALTQGYDGSVKRGLRHPDAAGGDPHAAIGQRGRRDAQASTLLADAIVAGHVDIVEHDVGRLLPVVTQLAIGRADPDAVGVRVDGK